MSRTPHGPAFRSIFVFAALVVLMSLASRVHASHTVTTTVVQPTCGSANGSATAVVTGGVGPFSYLWFPTFQTTQTATGLLFGGYQVTVTDASDGHTASAFATVSNLGSPAIVFISSDNVSCNAGSDGAATALATGGTAPYTYRWTYNSTPYPAFSRFLSGARAGTYTLEATDANGCVGTGSVVITEPPALALSFSTTPATTGEHCDGSATATASGGTPGYGYSWSPSGGNAATASNLCPGAYTATASDSNGCSIARFTFVGALAVRPHTVTTTVTNSTCGAGNGSATANVIDGTGSFTYAWSPGGQATQTATGLPAGTHTVVVTDTITGLQETATATINDPGAPAASISATTNVSCNGGSDGSATVAATGGVGPYTYAWSNGGTAATRTGLAAGTYGVQVTDANACVGSTSATITQPPLLAVTVATTPASSNLACDGGATATASGGIGGYTYSWSPSGGMAASMSGACPGSYTVTIGDANTCTTFASASIGVLANADLRLTQPDPAPRFVGDDVAYVITVANDGPDAATNASLTDAIPAGTTFVSFTQSSGPPFTCTTPAVGTTGLVTCTVGTLAAGASATFELVVRSDPGLPGATLVNTASVTSATSDSDPLDNTATANATLILQTDAAIALTAPASVVPGASIAYDVTVSVPGTAHARDLQWSLALPAGTTFTALASAAGFACTTPPVGAAGVVSCQVATLEAGSSASFIVTVQSDPGPAGATLTATATVSTTTPEVANSNNVATAGTTVATLATTSFSGPSATGTGTISASFTGGGAACSFTAPQFIAVTGHPRSPPSAPANVDFPHGLFDFTTVGCAPGAAITMTVTYPSALPPGTRYYKYGPTPTNATPHWYVLPATIAGNTAVFSITDGALGDDDLVANGTIVDQGGPGVGGPSAIATPTLSAGLLAALALLLLLAGATQARRRVR